MGAEALAPAGGGVPQLGAKFVGFTSPSCPVDSARVFFFVCVCVWGKDVPFELNQPKNMKYILLLGGGFPFKLNQPKKDAFFFSPGHWASEVDSFRALKQPNPQTPGLGLSLNVPRGWVHLPLSHPEKNSNKKHLARFFKCLVVVGKNDPG